MKHLDLFSGIGGFSLAAQWVWGDDHEIVAFVEINKQCQNILRRHWPNVPIHDDIRSYIPDDSAEIVCGGDPCPVRSKARSLGRSGKSADYSGYFLAVVQQCRPRWVLRENVPASDDKDFYAALELLGYRTVIVRTNSYPYTAQNRTRDIIVGCSEATMSEQFRMHLEQQSRKRIDKEKHTPQEGYPCLTTHSCRYDSRDGIIWDCWPTLTTRHGRMVIEDGYIYETGRPGLRVADPDERTALAGFPAGWLKGLSKTAVARVTGNAVVPQTVVPIMWAIKEVDK